MKKNSYDPKEFFERELWPQLNSEKFLLDSAEEAQKEGRLEDAILFLEGALLVEPNNRPAREKLEETKRAIALLRLTALLHDFAYTYYPSELEMFDLIWRTFKDVLPEDFPAKVTALKYGPVALFDRDPSELNTPKAIVLMNKLASENVQGLPDEKVKEAVTKICRDLSCSQELIDNIEEFILAR